MRALKLEELSTVEVNDTATLDGIYLIDNLYIVSKVSGMVNYLVMPLNVNVSAAMVDISRESKLEVGKTVPASFALKAIALASGRSVEHLKVLNE